MKISLYDIKEKVYEISHIVTGIAVTVVAVSFAIMTILLIIKIMQTL